MKWATRPGCHVDRLASAWLIRRFIDPEATFTFVDEATDVPPEATPFDMPGADLSHHGSDCTFETLLARYETSDPALAEIARIVHEADIADERFDAPEAAGLEAVISGLGLLHTDDEMINHGLTLFDALYARRREANETLSRLTRAE